MKKKLTKDEMREHFNRWLAIEDKLPGMFLNKALAINPNLSANKINNVAYGRMFDFEVLAVLERVVQENRAAMIKRQKLSVR